MKKFTAFIVILVVLAALSIGAYAVLSRVLIARQAQKLGQTSDAARFDHTLRIRGDGWIGYAPARSDQFARFLEAERIGVAFTDDGADVAARMAALANGDADIVLATLDGWLLNAEQHQYPGVIVLVIDESKGGDGIVARREIESLAGLAKPGVRIALTPNSPSDFLLRSVATHFDLAALKVAGPWRVETDGSAAAWEQLRGGNVQAAVLWEPELTRAANDPRFHRVFTTAQTQGLILDVAIASRRLVAEHPELAAAFARAWFQTLRQYQQEPDGLAKLVASDAKVDAATAKQMLAGIEFQSMTRNANRWLGVGPPDVAKAELVASIRSTVEVLVEMRQLNADPLGGNPRSVINSSFVESLNATGLGASATSVVFRDPAASTLAGGVDAAPAPVVFAALSNEQWAALDVVGTLKVRPIVFQSATSLLTLEGKATIDRIAADLDHYPRFRILLRGHTTPDGDEGANLALSRERAAAVAAYLQRVHDIPAARVRVEGVGGAMPLPQEEGESVRRWKGRLPRVELLLVEDPSVE